MGNLQAALPLGEGEPGAAPRAKAALPLGEGEARDNALSHITHALLKEHSAMTDLADWMRALAGQLGSLVYQSELVKRARERFAAQALVGALPPAWATDELSCTLVSYRLICQSPIARPAVEVCLSVRGRQQAELGTCVVTFGPEGEIAQLVVAPASRTCSPGGDAAQTGQEVAL
jgi:hypothetical protein